MPLTALIRSLKHRRPAFRLIVLVAFAFLWSPPTATAAVTCGPDPIANTATILCAPPDGKCDAGEVAIVKTITLPNQVCAFDLGGRALRVVRTLETEVSGRVRLTNAATVTVTASGRLKARGDTGAGPFISFGGRFDVESAGPIDIAGLVDVSGDPGGLVSLSAATGDITIRSGARIRGNGLGDAVEGERFADGGEVRLFALGGSVKLEGSFVLRGANSGFGGTIDVLAGHDAVLDADIDVSGGGGDGGSIDVVAGDHILVTRSIDAASRSEGGYGGAVSFDAGDDNLGGLVAGGTFRMTSGVTLDIQGSAADEFGGDGGYLDVQAAGSLTIERNVIVRLDSPATFDGGGGDVFLDSLGDIFDPFSARNGDIVLAGTFSARGGRNGGNGGSVDIAAGRDLLFDGSIDVTGSEGGDVDAAALRDIRWNGATVASGVGASSRAGAVRLTAGIATDGTLRVLKAIRNTATFLAGELTLAGCRLEVAVGVTIDAALSAPGPTSLPTIDVVGKHALGVGAGARVVAGRQGRINLVHAPGVTPAIGGATFDPAPTDTPAAFDGRYPRGCSS